MIDHHTLDWWIRHLLGIDSQQTAFYMFWSGPGPCFVGMITVLLGYYAIRLELRALKLEAQLLQRELAEHREEVEGEDPAG